MDRNYDTFSIYISTHLSDPNDDRIVVVILILTSLQKRW